MGNTIKNSRSFFVFLLALTSTFVAAWDFALTRPSMKQFNTPHFRIIYENSLEAIAPQLAATCEEAYGVLTRAYGRKVPVRTKAKLRLAATEHMQWLEKTPERVKSYFQDQHVKYAA